MWRVCVLCIFTVNRRVSLVGIWKRRRKRTVKQRARARASAERLSSYFQLTTFSSGFTHSFLPSKQQKQQKTVVNPVKLFFFLVSLQLFNCPLLKPTTTYIFILLNKYKREGNENHKTHADTHGTQKKKEIHGNTSEHKKSNDGICMLIRSSTCC